MAEIKEKNETLKTTDIESKTYSTPTSATTTTTKIKSKYFLVSIFLRLLLFAATLAAVILVITSKQKEYVFWPPLTRNLTLRVAKYGHSPALM